jgi:hypothetical protein
VGEASCSRRKRKRGGGASTTPLLPECVCDAGPSWGGTMQKGRLMRWPSVRREDGMWTAAAAAETTMKGGPPWGARRGEGQRKVDLFPAAPLAAADYDLAPIHGHDDGTVDQPRPLLHESSSARAEARTSTGGLLGQTRRARVLAPRRRCRGARARSQEGRTGCRRIMTAHRRRRCRPGMSEPSSTATAPRPPRDPTPSSLVIVVEWPASNRLRQRPAVEHEVWVCRWSRIVLSLSCVCFSSIAWPSYLVNKRHCSSIGG